MATWFKEQVSKLVHSREERLFLIIGSVNCLERLFCLFFENGARVRGVWSR